MRHRQRRWGLHSRVHVHPWATQTAAPVNHQIPECMCPCTPGPVQTQMRTLSGPSTSSRSCTYENVETCGFVHASLGVRARECKQGYVHTSEAVHTQKGACLRVLHTQGRAHPRGQPADPSGGGRGAQFPPYLGTAAGSRRHLRSAGSRRTCRQRSPGAWAFVVPVSGCPSRGSPARQAQATRRSTKWRARGGAKAERPGAAPTLDSRQGAPPAPLRRRTARRAFPRSFRRALGHKGLEGKHGTFKTCGVARGLERPGADSQGRSRARRHCSRAQGGARHCTGSLALPLQP